jgi:hypothetical protein
VGVRFRQILIPFFSRASLRPRNQWMNLILILIKRLPSRRQMIATNAKH